MTEPNEEFQTVYGSLAGGPKCLHTVQTLDFHPDGTYDSICDNCGEVTKN